jgi:glycine dehydrogenase subunit 2
MRNHRATQLIFELSKSGRRGVTVPPAGVLADRPLESLLPSEALATTPPPLPEVPEPEVVRHFTNLSTLNMSVDTHFYPLGSCTMKYNPKRNERLASLPGMARCASLPADSTLQGLLQLLYELAAMLARLAACRPSAAAGRRSARRA